MVSDTVACLYKMATTGVESTVVCLHKAATARVGFFIVCLYKVATASAILSCWSLQGNQMQNSVVCLYKAATSSVKLKSPTLMQNCELTELLSQLELLSIEHTWIEDRQRAIIKRIRGLNCQPTRLVWETAQQVPSDRTGDVSRSADTSSMINDWEQVQVNPQRVTINEPVPIYTTIAGEFQARQQI